MIENISNKNRANTACTGFVGVCAVFKHFSGFGFYLLPNSYPSRPQTSKRKPLTQAVSLLPCMVKVIIKKKGVYDGR